MILTVTTLTGQMFPMDVAEDLELENFKAICEAESGFPAEEIVLLFNGAPLTDNKKTMKDYGLVHGDVLILQKVRKAASSQPQLQPAATGAAGPMSMLPDFSQIQIPGRRDSAGRVATSSSGSSSSHRDKNDPVWIREMLLANPDQVALLKQQNPRLAEALNSPEEFTKILREQQAARAERERLRIRMLTADPMDIEAQRLIAQEIESNNIEHNMELAMEYNPESFGTVIMLYIDCKVNGYKIKAFVDSGAQATIMSQAAAERCNIMRLVDRRWAGIAKGVGTQRIIGRVHMTQIQIQDDFLPCSFSILEDQPMDMLLGLDMLKRHQCCIDLRRNVLVIGSTGTETHFLPESELPECARLSSRNENQDEAMQVSETEFEDRELTAALERSKAEAAQAGQAGTSSTSGPNPNLTVLPTDKFTEENVQALIKYGFSRDKVIEELRDKNGDVTQATAALFAKSLKLK